MPGSCPVSEQSEDTGHDINDVFEDIFLTEERIVEESFHQGLEDGQQQESVVEAHDYGYKKGAEIGREIGFYQTVVSEISTQEEVTSNEKVAALLGEVQATLNKFPCENDPDVDLLHGLQQIRNKYRRLCALLKLPFKYVQTNDLSF
ncbi:protein LTO1 homolog [Anopheles aquasalis]|uniref:protein LTO1 homolog n=1 Tax=Anopheles aquasalis TaxID=42839 RepID=UPI00215B2F2B|nr:protein LTO1 homolog [Anopheles aquasalis]